MEIGDFSSDCSSDPMCSFATGDIMSGGFAKRVYVRNSPGQSHFKPRYQHGSIRRFDKRLQPGFATDMVYYDYI